MANTNDEISRASVGHDIR